jgi:hypothetical protein
LVVLDKNGLVVLLVGKAEPVTTAPPASTNAAETQATLRATKQSIGPPFYM